MVAGELGGGGGGGGDCSARSTRTQAPMIKRLTRVCSHRKVVLDPKESAKNIHRRARASRPAISGWPASSYGRMGRNSVMGAPIRDPSTASSSPSNSGHIHIDIVTVGYSLSWAIRGRCEVELAYTSQADLDLASSNLWPELLKMIADINMYNISRTS